MTILCITAERLPGIRPCTLLGLHSVACLDHEGNREDLRPGLCHGCLPRTADVGYLCRGCYERVTDAAFRWRDFARLVEETEGRAVSPDAGRGSTPAGYTNLPLTTLTLDECERLLHSQQARTVDLWVHTVDGARDAVMFAHAAARAYQSLEVEVREAKTERVRCPHCHELAIWRNTAEKVHGATVVTCGNCGEFLDRIRDDTTRWFGSEDCEHAGHIACRNFDCRCDCHQIGRTSTEQGLSALWDADQHATGYVDRAAWETDGRQLWRVEDEEERMTGRVIFEPPTPTACERGDCDGKPRADQYRDGTIWECDHCGAQWEVWSGAQYNEPFSAWRLHRAGSARRAPHVPTASVSDG